MVSTQIITPATWAETRRNRYVAAGFGMATISAGTSSVLVNMGLYSGGYAAVTPGEVISLAELAPMGVRFQYGFASIPPVAGTALTGAVNAGNATTQVEAITVPAGAAYVILYLSNVNTLTPGYVGLGPSLALSPPFNGDTAPAGEKRYSWLGTPGASASIEEVYVPEVYGPVYEEVTLTSPDDSITFRALPENGGFVYNNQTLQRWYEPAATEPDVDSRPNANGSYGLGQVFTAEHRPIIVGQYYGTDSLDAKAQRQRLIAMRNEGNPILMTVKDESGLSTRREVWLVDYAAPFAADFSHFTFDLDLIAPDALRYGDETSDTDGMPTQGSGLVWNLGTAVSGLFFDWGTAGNPGQISLTNAGGAASFPRIEVGGPGAINGGFRITEIETGRELTFSRTLGLADTVIFDSRTQRATLNGGDVTGLMTARQWYSIPKGATRRYQITPLGAVSGTPTITGYVGAAWL